MDTKTIVGLLAKSITLKGVYPRDLIPSIINKKPASLIINTDTSDKPGEHWVVIHLNKDGSGEYFDSYGLPPLHTDIITYLNDACPKGWGYSTTTLQCLKCITCGHYCVLYVKFKDKKLSLCDFISIFSRDQYINDLIVKKFIEF